MSEKRTWGGGLASERLEMSGFRTQAQRGSAARGRASVSAARGSAADRHDLAAQPSRPRGPNSGHGGALRRVSDRKMSGTWTSAPRAASPTNPPPASRSYCWGGASPVASRVRTLKRHFPVGAFCGIITTDDVAGGILVCGPRVLCERGGMWVGGRSGNGSRVPGGRHPCLPRFRPMRGGAELSA